MLIQALRSEINNYTQILELLNNWDIELSDSEDSGDLSNEELDINDPMELVRESYVTLLKQLYGLEVSCPEYLIVNGLRANFIPFQNAIDMLQRDQIHRYIIDPLLQPWGETSNRIITLFGRNGIMYLVKAQYKANKIFPPV